MRGAFVDDIDDDFPEGPPDPPASVHPNYITSASSRGSGNGSQR